ncbi:hypothetical protein [Streptomyces sp. MAR4 CNX-425]|uniref:hypothetical protein n=1 Tax=Streptomyces sp. MAR4 CNX-425 TaxID=3406343 RepID=UPI003B500E3B
MTRARVDRIEDGEYTLSFTGAEGGVTLDFPFTAGDGAGPGRAGPGPPARA